MSANDRQTELLEKEDPRFFAIDKLGTGLAMISTTEKVAGDIVSFALPSSASMFLSSALNFQKEVSKINIDDCFDKHPAPQGTWPEDHTKLFNFFELMIGQIIFSFTALETFSNIMIPEGYIFQRNRIDPKSNKEYDKDKTERLISLDVKLDMILPEVLAVTSPSTNTELWDKFLHLKQLRDRLIHLKSADMRANGPETETIWGDLLREHKTDFVSQAHALIGHFISNKNGFRWFKKFPYK
jgi:hypothetical protein